MDKYNEYQSIVGYKFEYVFDDGTVISYRLKKKNFLHLIGLHKLTDIPLISDFNDANGNTYAETFFYNKAI